MDFNWKSLVGTVAPILGTALGGPFGAMASSIICSVLGVDTNSEEAVIANAMKNATPEQLVALQNAERQFKLDMEKLNVDLAKVDADDRNSARQREAAVKDNTPKVLAGLAVIGSLGASGWIIGHGLSGFDKDTALLIGTIVGYLFNDAKQVYSYYFGSSSSSKNKDELLYNSTPIK